MLKFQKSIHTWSVILGLMLFSALAVAGDIRCPVCGQLFDDDVKECPNDGTNLALIKRHQPEKTAPEKKTLQTDSKAAEEARPKPEKTKKRKRRKRGKARYKRHDAGGERQRADTEEKDLYSDRDARLPSASRGEQADTAQRARERMERQRVFESQDQTRRANFAASRNDLWTGRWNKLLAENRSYSGIRTLKEAEMYRRFAPNSTIGARFSWLPAEGDDGQYEPGLLIGPELELNFLRRHIRLGFSSFMGIRKLDAGNEMLFLEQIVLGYQWPWRFSPFVMIRGGVGAMVGENLRGSQLAFASSVGGEAGLDAYVSPTMTISPSLGVQTYFADGSIWTSFTAKFAFGF